MSGLTIATKKQRVVRNYALGLIEMYQTNNVYDLAKCLDIKIIKITDENSLFGRMLGNDEGLYYANLNNRQQTIFIKSDLDYQYEKFIIAHEIGHAVMHIEINSASFNRNLILKNKFEREATYFALVLLDIKLDPVELEGFNLEQIASILHITKDSLELL